MFFGFSKSNLLINSKILNFFNYSLFHHKLILYLRYTMKILFFLATLMLPFNPIFANDCSIQITGSDMMKYDLQEINISSKCVSFEIKLKHGGKLPVSAMGHNIVITEESDFMPVAQLINMITGLKMAISQLLTKYFSDLI